MAERLVRGTVVADRLVRGTAVAERLVRGTALAELLAREPSAQRTAGRDVVAELLLAGNHRHRGLPAGAQWQSKGRAVAERHREDVAYCGTADAEPAGRLAGAPMRLLPGRDAGTEQGRRQCESAAAEQGRRQCTGADAEPAIRGRRCGARALAQRKSAPAEQGRWQRARAGAGRQILSDSPSDLAITSAAQVLPYVFTAVRGISQSC